MKDKIDVSNTAGNQSLRDMKNSLDEKQTAMISKINSSTSQTKTEKEPHRASSPKNPLYAAIASLQKFNIKGPIKSSSPKSGLVSHFFKPISSKEGSPARISPKNIQYKLV